MKRVDLVRHLERHGCRLLREGGSHSVYLNPVTRKASTVRAIARSTNSLLARLAATSKSQPREVSVTTCRLTNAEAGAVLASVRFLR